MSNDKTKNSNNQKEVIIDFPDANILQVLSGEQNANIKHVEEKLDVRVARTEQGLKVQGQAIDVDLVSDLLFQLRDILTSGDSLFQGDFERALTMLSQDRRLRLSELFRDQIRISGRKHSIVPKSQTQKIYLEAIKRNDVVFGVGPAGTGKTYLAMAMAVSALLKKEVKRVVLCRPAVEAGEKLGFLPGDLAEKVNPYLRPLYDALHDMVELDKAQELIEKGIIEVAPLAFMRGRTLSNAFVILDEAQNTNRMQMKMLLTRIGQNSKCVITGDITQIDLPRGVASGLTEAVTILKDVPGIATINFNRTDVIRHPIVSAIVAAYDRKAKVSSGD
jgi:phosphate starvation-inducible PhoH-like protein